MCESLSESLAVGSDIELLLSSPGGEVAPVQMLLHDIRLGGARLTVRGSVLVASAATLILAGAHYSTVTPDTVVMLHQPWSWFIGDADELRSGSEALTATWEGMCAIYRDAAERRGKSAAWLDSVTRDIWLTAEQAVEYGLCDAIEEVHMGAEPVEAKAEAVEAKAKAKAEAVEAKAKAKAEAVEAKAEAVEAKAEAVEAKAEAVEAKAEEGKAEAVEAKAEAVEAKAEEGKAEADYEGIIKSLSRENAALREQVERAAAAEAQRAAQRSVDAAVQDGRIAPGQRDLWINAVRDSAAAAALLDKLPAGLPVEVIGQSADENDNLAARFAALFG